MRTSLLIISLLSLGGCALLPPHDPSQAWVDLRTNPDSTLLANQVDEKPLDDERFFQVSPGAHELQVRLQFAVEASNIGPSSPPHQRDCRLNLEYPQFAAGQRYRLVAGHIGFRPWAKLYDEQNQLLARGREGGCGEF
ncbi:hypothetical protein D3880_00170 [Pseudomonas cavernae]|uniref:Lipoprotein n=1 Tax=Pseudomonas cavernae TaxID=2320867 RepID=A0A385YVH1_9PSED|nr:hypothetical protein [Pseudomonas cavernae]AYC30895.1 hypothetical protein D3880_00170 [Pseudomonas cavernae]